MAMYDIIRKAVRDVDGVNADMAAQVAGVVRGYDDKPLTMSDARAMMRDIDKVMNRAYGLSPTRAQRSSIFRAITNNTDLAAEASFRNVYGRIRRDALRANPELWGRIESGMLKRTHDPFATVYLSLFGPDARRRAIIRAGKLDPNRRWVSPDGYRLSDRVWRSGWLNRRKIDTTIRRGVMRGEGTDTIAKRLEQYLDPKYAPLDYQPNGKIVRRTGAWKRNPSGASAARRLARTEVKQMSDTATVQAVDSIPIKGVGTRWTLSAAHPRIDICDTLARRHSPGLPAGVYTSKDFPKPPHPFCMCVAVPHVPDRDQVLRQIADHYDVGDRTVTRANVADTRFITSVGDEYFGDVNPLSEMHGPSPAFGPGGRSDPRRWDDPPGWFDDDDRIEFINDQMNDSVDFGMLNILDESLPDVKIADFHPMRNAFTDANDPYESRIDFLMAQDTVAEAWTEYKKLNIGGGIDRIEFYTPEPGKETVQMYVNLGVDTNNRRIVHWNVMDEDLGTSKHSWKVNRRPRETRHNVGDANPLISLVHETGHLDHYSLMERDFLIYRSPDGAPFWNDANKRPRNPESMKHGWHSTQERDIARKVSRYGSQDPDEFVAEVYAAMVNGDELTEDVLDLYMDFWGPDPFSPGKYFGEDVEWDNLTSNPYPQFPNPYWED